MREFPSIQMVNGEIFDGERIRELTEYIINKFSDEGLSHDEARIVLDKTKEIIGEFAIVHPAH